YTELRSAIAGLESLKMKTRFEVLSEDIAQKRAKADRLEEKEKELLLKIEELRSFLKAKDDELGNLMAVERKARSNLDEINTGLADVAADISAASTRSRSLDENLARNESERKKAEGRMESLEAEIVRLTAAEESAKGKREAREEELMQARSKLSAEEENLARLRIRVRDLRADIKGINNRLAKASEGYAQTKTRRENSISLAEVAEEELNKITARREELADEAREMKEGLAETESRLASYRSRISEQEAKLEGITDDISGAEKDRQAAIERHSRLTGERSSLKDRLEDKSRQTLRRRLGKAFRGRMEELIVYPDEFEAALEAVLYDILGFAAASAIPEVADISLEGQAGLVVDRSLKPFNAPRPSDRRIVSWLADEVKVKKGAPGLLGRRLEGWAIVKIEDLLGISQDYPEFSFVTREGAAVRADGVTLLGKPKGALADLRKLKGLDSRIKDLDSEISGLEKKLTSLNRMRGDTRKNLDKTRDDFLAERSRIQFLASEYERAASRVEEITRERDRLRSERDKRIADSREAGERLTELSGKVANLTEERTEKERELSGLEERLLEEESTLRDKLSGLNSYLLAVGHAEDEERSTREAKERLIKEVEGLKQVCEELEGENTRMVEETAKLKDRLVRLEETREKLSAGREEERAKLGGIDTTKIIETKREHEEKLSTLEADLGNLRNELIGIRTDMVLLEKEHAELEQDIVPVDEETEGLSLEEIDEKLDDAVRRLQGLGPVNEYAEVQYPEEKAEYDRLKAQHQDVTAAAETLRGIISQIDTEARARFETTFRAVRQEFRRTFIYFFPGGEADLKFSEPDDPFNSPVEITARPEGKQLKRLSQLSDGERTMLGISLLFSFYAVKPAPFLFIDELDAPLDDTNVLKFASYLAHIKDKIQVFVITHNKRTMEKADTIYGVTMEEPGLSRIISVRLRDVKRHHVAVEET
ncbi:hypothetical protein GF359_01630, partial [candidate division WOR-3 bacterium]|nr:hypothetical protein [candidate division WOR-3 bacterium]MBD3363894.1 hypothetical protein [candidate division WOR-3 bacterium]